MLQMLKVSIIKYLESLHTLFKWNIGITRVAFSRPATATASHICIASSTISAITIWTYDVAWTAIHSIDVHLIALNTYAWNYHHTSIQSKMTQRKKTKRKIFTNFIKQVLDITRSTSIFKNKWSLQKITINSISIPPASLISSFLAPTHKGLKS